MASKEAKSPQHAPLALKIAVADLEDATRALMHLGAKTCLA